jgi:glycosyltransferase involved in cell wall biosynthesis
MSSTETAPRVGAILLTWNCAKYVRAALDSVLRQDTDGPMEVIVSDDCSSDDTFAIVRSEVATYRGPHVVQVLQQPLNTGSKSAHLNAIVPRARSDILVSFDGDDVSQPWRVRRIAGAFAANPRTCAVYSAFSVMDADGRRLGKVEVPHPPAKGDSLAWFAQVDAYAAGGTLAFRREIFERFGLLDARINEDIVLPFRAALLGDVTYLAEPLVCARRHAASFTADLDRFASLAAFRRRTHIGIERARSGAASRLADIERAEALFPDRAQRFAGLRPIVADSLRVAESSEALVSPSLRRRLAALYQLYRRRAYPAEVMQHVALAISPGAYLRYKRRRFGVTATASGASSAGAAGDSAPRRTV